MPKKQKDTANRKANLKTSADFPNGWQSPNREFDHKMDLIDQGVSSMEQSIRMMYRGGVPFSMETYKLLLANFRKCAKLNNALLPRQRVLALDILMSNSKTADLEQILNQAIEK